jgi:hypothetical protein
MGASFCTSRRPAAVPGESLPMSDVGNDDGNDGEGSAGETARLPAASVEMF